MPGVRQPDRQRIGTAFERGQQLTSAAACRKESRPVSDAHLIEPNRRDFLYVATGMAAVVGAGSVAWPFIDQMRPDASTLALASIEVDVASLEPGMSLTAKWRGKPVFVRNRTPEEIESSKKVALDELKDPLARNANLPADAKATDIDRSAGEGKENWLVMVGVCTHLGCIPLGQQGEYGGWFCPCHGSVYDTSGRIRKGPAPENMAVPVFQFISDTKIRIG
ncbi:MAG: ubiquinol-cytochrome c reductase iron-sulfur subunit [Rhizobiales bacterium]|nr:ubiquinol-cytochrome c reductase iron-sulfur subunit [Hyphomicrobiales bacterium]